MPAYHPLTEEEGCSTSSKLPGFPSDAQLQPGDRRRQLNLVFRVVDASIDAASS